jgi:hypothetical protein
MIRSRFESNLAFNRGILALMKPKTVKGPSATHHEDGAMMRLKAGIASICLSMLACVALSNLGIGESSADLLSPRSIAQPSHHGLHFIAPLACFAEGGQSDSWSLKQPGLDRGICSPGERLALRLRGGGKQTPKKEGGESKVCNPQPLADNPSNLAPNPLIALSPRN